MKENVQGHPRDLEACGINTSPQSGSKQGRQLLNSQFFPFINLYQVEPICQRFKSGSLENVKFNRVFQQVESLCVSGVLRETIHLTLATKEAPRAQCSCPIPVGKREPRKCPMDLSVPQMMAQNLLLRVHPGVGANRKLFFTCYGFYCQHWISSVSATDMKINVSWLIVQKVKDDWSLPTGHLVMENTLVMNSRETHALHHFLH